MRFPPSMLGYWCHSYLGFVEAAMLIFLHGGFFSDISRHNLKTIFLCLCVLQSFSLFVCYDPQALSAGVVGWVPHDHFLSAF